MKVRLHGTREEVAEATRRLAEAFHVVAVSHPYSDRGTSTLVRVYLEVRRTPADQPLTTTTSGRRSQ